MSLVRSLAIRSRTTDDQPTLWQACSEVQRAARKFDIALARTKYNYTRSYLPPLPFSADVPSGEEFTPQYIATVAEPILEVVENLKNAVLERIEAKIASDIDVPGLDPWLGQLKGKLHNLEVNLGELSEESVFGLLGELREVITDLKGLVQTVSDAPVSEALSNVRKLPGDLRRVVTGFESLIAETEHKDLLTTFLQDAMFATLRQGDDGNYLRPRSLRDYEDYFTAISPPEMLSLPREPWMGLGRCADQEPWSQDWFLGYMQIGGFNTTQLCGVVADEPSNDRQTVRLDDLRRKFPLSDSVFGQVIGDRSATLESAAKLGRLYVVDLSQMEGIAAGDFHGDPRYVTAPIALFYWNPTPSGPFPPSGAMQPIGIQLSQHPDEASAPIFTPVGVGGETPQLDPGGQKWRLAKYFLNNAVAIQHETVAHLGDAHLTIEPMVIATHRTLPESHPLFALLWPHFRFTLSINNSAFHSLIVPGGVVASVLGTSIEGSMEMVREAHLKWQFDDHLPDRLFTLRGVDDSRLPEFPFRDDTLLVWTAIRKFVGTYLSIYYADDAAVAADPELQDWVRELTAPDGAAVRGMRGLDYSGEHPRIERLSYLGDVVAMIIYTASARHASVNYAQFPLMAFPPSVSGGAYQPPPTRDDTVDEARVLATMPPIDVALYQASFSYLLSAVQYDKLGHYTRNERRPYFKDKRVAPAVVTFQADLAAAEAIIRKRNESRPMPYENQIPSQIPNSISI